ncbi:F-box/FBD/LRR-repeat protein At4g26340 isoform X1 [Lathyrus oleraceus]|uniref:F-box domain-containing protein n=1 Tax=Pisum sativum TaxID=3888 RepID=A0A9D5AV37_PEA|nr:F-box/FBD/LRR-repeat protein At4g26340-like isoform X1 [Pisum sativum]KAI5419844.1 hypothetical protein KIW84_043848 [Pisum sativum]
MAPKMLTSKRRKEVENHGGGTDRMSSLPDSVLCNILSFLPTRTSVATMSLVSRRWRHLWQHLQVFYFDDELVQGSKRIDKFTFFVNAALAYRKSRNIRKFQLNCYISRSQRVCQFRRDCANMWIGAAINPTLEELSLSITDDIWGSKVLSPVLLPPSLLNCTNLVSLSLVGDIGMNVQGFELHFPSLKWLKLDADIVDSEIVLLSACPILETLQHKDFLPGTWARDHVSPSSQRLNSADGSFSWTFLEVDYFRNGASKYTPGVTGNGYFHRANKTTLGIIGNLQSMVDACIDFFPLQISQSVDPILKRIQTSFNELDIQLHHSISKCSLRPQVLNHPEFRNLLHLKFMLPCFNTNLLVDVLEKCHMIQVFIIQSNKEEQPPLRTWDPKSTTVPKCLKFHLTYIHIEGYQGFEDELTFAEYILRNGYALETMLIFVDASMEQSNKYCSLKRLTEVPRRSSRCRLKFDPAVSS